MEQMANVYSLLIGLLVVVLLVILIYLSTITREVGSWITWCYNIKHIRSLPSPPGHWIWGHIAEVGPEEQHLNYVQKSLKDYPKYCVFWIGPLLPEIFTADVETMKRLLQRPGEPKSRIYGYLYQWIGDGLLTTSGKKWRRHRKMLTPAFHFDTLKQYMSVYNEVSHKLLEVWSPLADKGKSVEISEYVSLYTLDVLLRCIYSVNSNCLENKDGVTYVKSIYKLADLFIARVLSPLHAIDWVYFSSSAGRSYLHHSDVVHKFSEGVIMQRRKELLLKDSLQTRKYLDFLDILLSAKDEDGKTLTDTEIREEVDTFMFEGHDTTASGLLWTLYCLALHKEHQEKCRKEIRGILADRDSNDITWEDLSKLSYTTMCIKESLRLYPPVPYIAKELSEDFFVEGNRIPKGTWVTLGILAAHHDPLVWDNPEVFDPMRFTAENYKKRDPFSYLPFAAGPRNCIGQHFAMHELKVTVAHVLNRFNLEVDEDHVVERYAIVVLKALNGIKLKLSHISLS